MSQTAIARGEAMRQQLGLSNLQLHAADVCQWECGTTPFDYIVAHGFFSWVPVNVQDTLLALCQRILSAHGIAYISYNALPGCHPVSYTHLDVYKRQQLDYAADDVRHLHAMHRQLQTALTAHGLSLIHI